MEELGRIVSRLADSWVRLRGLQQHMPPSSSCHLSVDCRLSQGLVALEMLSPPLYFWVSGAEGVWVFFCLLGFVWGLFPSSDPGWTQILTNKEALIQEAGFSNWVESTQSTKAPYLRYLDRMNRLYALIPCEDPFHGMSAQHNTSILRWPQSEVVS